MAEGVEVADAATGDERVGYAGRPGLISLLTKNFFLTLATVGIYRFWAATRLRRYLAREPSRPPREAATEPRQRVVRAASPIYPCR